MPGITIKLLSVEDGKSWAAGNFKFASLRLAYRSAPVDVAVYTGSTRIDAQAANMKRAGVYGAYTLGATTAMLSVTNSGFRACKHTHLMGSLRASLGQWVLRALLSARRREGARRGGGGQSGFSAPPPPVPPTASPPCQRACPG